MPWGIQISDERAKLILYAAVVEAKLEAPAEVHRLYFELEPGVLAANGGEPLECVYQRLQDAIPFHN